MPANHSANTDNATPFPGHQPSTHPSLVSFFSRLIQDERNASVFYGYLSRIAPREDMRPALTGISENAAERMQAYTGLMSVLCGMPFIPEETEINMHLGFTDGIALAIMEENKSLQMLANILDQVHNIENAQTIQRIFNKKMTNRNLLSFMQSNMNYPFTI
jgi:rubrerythrin